MAEGLEEVKRRQMYIQSRSRKVGTVKYIFGQNLSLPPMYENREGKWEHYSGGH